MSSVLPETARPTDPRSTMAARVPSHPLPPPQEDEDPSRAIERLVASRQLLRAAMLPPEPHYTPAKLGGRAPTWWQRLLDQPYVRLGLDTARGWWSHHPLRTAGVVANEASRGVIAPVARRDPLKLVGLAFCVGIIVAWFRPWRLLLKPHWMIGLIPKVASTAVKRMPVDSWMKIIGAATGARRAAAGRTTRNETYRHDIAATSARPDPMASE